METTTARPTPDPAGPPHADRDAALRRLGRLKAAVTVASVLGFGVLSGVIARQAVGTTGAPSANTSGATQGVPAAPPDSGTGTGTGTGNGQVQPPQDQGTGSQGLQGQDPAQGTPGSQGGFFNQGQGGYGFGDGNSAQGQGPVAGSGAS